MTDSYWQGNSTPIIFVRPIGIRAGDAMRLMEAAKLFHGEVRWRMAPVGVVADAYLIHAHSIVEQSQASTEAQPSGHSHAPTDSTRESSSGNVVRKISLDSFGYHRGRPVCVLGQGIDTSALDPDELAPLNFPDALQELTRGLSALLEELIGTQMLYTLGSMAWDQRHKWGTNRLHAIESGQLIAVIEPKIWQFHLLDGCTVERMAQADFVPMPTTGQFTAPNFRRFMLELALWEFAKRCPEPMLAQILPASYLQEALTHRRTPPMKQSVLGDHCLAIMRSLDTHSRTADELQTGLRLSRPALLRALTCLAVVRAIQPESKLQHHNLWHRLQSVWSRWRGQPSSFIPLRKAMR